MRMNSRTSLLLAAAAMTAACTAAIPVEQMPSRPVAAAPMAPPAPLAPPDLAAERLRTIIAPVSQERLHATVERLVAFGTRHTLSTQAHPTRGIGAAVRWAEAEMKGYGLPTLQTCDTVTKLPRVPTPTKVCNAVAIQRGTERPNDVVIIQGHIDSRVTDVMNATSDAPGANDDGSGTAAVLEAARVLSRHKFPATIVYGVLSGEEQGLLGGKILADYAKAQGWNVVTVLNNDIVGNSCSSDGMCNDTHVRVLSEGPRSQGQTELAAQTHSLGGENDAPSRNISRFLDRLADRLQIIGLDVTPIWRTDRWGRGGDHIPFLELGYPAARLSVALENYNYQHQDLRAENGIEFGDTIDKMDFPYLTKVTKLNVAAVAALASAPPPPANVRAEGAVQTFTRILWDEAAGAQSYVVRWRPTDASSWAGELLVPRFWNGAAGHTSGCIMLRGDGTPPLPEQRKDFGCQAELKGLRVDDWIFGVAAVSPDGFESPVVSAIPGGDFRPYAPPPPAE